MRYQTVKDVVEHARQLHKQIAGFYKQLSNRQHQERIKMLLDYLARHEANLEQMLANFDKDHSQKIWDEWFQFATDDTLSQTLQGAVVHADMTVDEIVTLALQLDDYFINLYQDMALHASSAAVKGVFENLLAVEQQEKNRTVRTALELKDL
jgi:rubrerythrin